LGAFCFVLLACHHGCKHCFLLLESFVCSRSSEIEDLHCMLGINTTEVYLLNPASLENIYKA